MSQTEEITRYEPAQIESRWMDRWLEAGAFDANAEDGGEPYTIAVPPPNVTGALHLGHALNASIQDMLIRAKRMQGYNALWIPGTDHAGIATQMMVEKQLRAEGKSRHDLGRTAFLERVQAWKDEYAATIMGQFKRLGSSMDYRRERFTMDEGYANAVLQVFVHLYERGYVYRDNYLVNWDAGSGSAISDLEVEQKELTDELVHVDYPVVDGDGHVTIATVRPETIPADVAVAVHPDDARYASLIGKHVRVPFTDRDVPVIADDYVDPEFGTGALKITPGHDQNDFEIGKRHDLSALSAIGFDGCMTDLAGDFAGMHADEARAKMTDALADMGLLRHREDYVHAVPHSVRSGARIEPLISLQWFCDMQQLASRAITAVEEGEVRFHPESASNIFYSWMRDIKPWCLSRQLWWGHQLPVWYRGDEIHVSMDGPDDPDGWTRDEDVLDTWFSSGLWTFATLGWPDGGADLETFHPTAVLLTARDIINLWVARMMMFSYEFLNEKPFSDVYIHSVIQAPDGRRMSKSLGTGIDPLEMADKYGADATRYGLLAMSSTQDVRFNEGKIREGRELANKLWNASRLVRMAADDDTLASVDAGSAGAAPAADGLIDSWIVRRAREVAAELQGYLDRYDLSLYTKTLYQFIWSEFCDWYLELAKERLYDEGRREAATATAGWVLDVILRLAHPVMPHVTEEISSQTWPSRDGFVATNAWPATDGASGSWNGDVVADFGRLRDLVVELRSVRQGAGVAPGETLPGRLDITDPTLSWMRDLVADIAALTRVDFAAGADMADGEGVEIALPGLVCHLGGIDRAQLAARVASDLDQARAEVARAQGKLGNEKFTAGAPAAVVAAEQEKLATWQEQVQQLEAIADRLGG